MCRGGVGKARLLQQFADAFSLVAGPGSADGRAQRGGLRRQFGGQDGGHGAPRPVRPAILGLARAREQPCAQGTRTAFLACPPPSPPPFPPPPTPPPVPPPLSSPVSPP